MSGYTSYKSKAGVYEKIVAINHGKSVESITIIPIDKVEHNKMIQDEINELEKKIIKYMEHLKLEAKFTSQFLKVSNLNQGYLENEIKAQMIDSFLKTKDLVINKEDDMEMTTFSVDLYLLQENKLSEMIKNIKKIERINTDKRISVLLEEVKETLNI